MIRRRRVDERPPVWKLEELERDASGYVLLFGELPPRDAQLTGSRFQAFCLLRDRERIKTLWQGVRVKALEAWTRDCPGTRPHGWWAVEAAEPRRHVGGSGRVINDFCENFRARFGVPMFLDVTPLDPPAVESEAAYLERLGLLLPGERSRLMAEDFEPELLGDSPDAAEVPA